MSIQFTYPFYPSTNNNLSRITFISYEVKTLNDFKYLEFYFDILGMIRSSVYRTTIVTGFQVSPDNILGKLLTGLGFSFDSAQQYLSHEYTNEILDALNAHKGKHYVARVYKDDNVFPKYIIDVDTIKPFN